VGSLQVSPDGELIAGLGRGGINIWHATPPEYKGGIATKTFHPLQIRFSPDSRVLAVAGDDHGIRLWRTAELKPDPNGLPAKAP
jgi:WD40 repeat protein